MIGAASFGLGGDAVGPVGELYRVSPPGFPFVDARLPAPGRPELLFIPLFLGRLGMLAAHRPRSAVASPPLRSLTAPPALLLLLLLVWSSDARHDLAERDLAQLGSLLRRPAVKQHREASGPSALCQPLQLALEETAHLQQVRGRVRGRAHQAVPVRAVGAAGAVRH